MASLVLYHNLTCPYCLKVRNFMSQNNISVSLKNTEDTKIREELIKLGGKSQVPSLVIDGKALYESDDIIEWMKRNLLK